jgi:seryl-tRNA synthetase
MLDIKLLRQKQDEVTIALKKKGYEIPWDKFHDLDAQRKQLQTDSQKLQAERNASAKKIGMAKAKGEDIKPLLDEVAGMGEKLTAAEDKLSIVMQDLKTLLLQIPNIPDDSVPAGDDESANIEVKKWGEPKQFSFEPKNHMELGEALARGIDAEAGVRIARSRFTVLRGQIAKLHRALAQFMLDQHTEKNGYTEYYVPYLAKKDCLLGTGQLPKFSEDLFHIGGDWDLSLIPTAEVALTNLVREQITPLQDLPLKMTAHTPCFRSEAGSYGRDMQGLIRQHQFDKIELVQVVTAEQSAAALDEMVAVAESVLQALELPYRVVQLCGGDLGFSAVKTFDLEVWVPSQNLYREISSCSNCCDFQARRMQARHYQEDGATALVHTLNGSALAVGRTLLAVLENNQQQDGSIEIPAVLQPYMGGACSIII